MLSYCYMGRTGLKVSELCLGAMTFGREIDEQTSHHMLDRFAEVGGNFIDTADVYGPKTSEEILGRWLKTKRREDFIIATKIRWGMGSGPNDEGLSRKHILEGVHDSLRRLDTDYIDLYQIHCWDPGTPLEETLSTLNNLVQSGKVRYIGASNISGWQLQKAIDLSNQMGWEAFSCFQPLYNLMERSIELEILPVCLNEGVGMIPWSPLRGGWLTGKFYRGMDGPPAGTRIDVGAKYDIYETWERYNNERTWTIIDALLDVAKTIGKTPAQVALNWVLNRPGVTAPIFGATKMKQFEDNLGAVGWKMDEEHEARLTAAGELIGNVLFYYPYEILAASAPGRSRG